MPDPDLSLADGAIAPWRGPRTAQYFNRVLEAVADEYGFDLDTPWNEADEAAAEGVLIGTGDAASHVAYQNRYGRAAVVRRRFEGVIP